MRFGAACAWSLLVLAATAVLSPAVIGGASAQSLSPLTDERVIFGSKRAVRVRVGNPEKTVKDYVIRAYEPDLKTPADGVRIHPEKFRLASGKVRVVRVVFDVPDSERQVAVCASYDYDDQKIRPGGGIIVRTRVCGRYVGRKHRKR